MATSDQSSIPDMPDSYGAPLNVPPPDPLGRSVTIAKPSPVSTDDSSIPDMPAEHGNATGVTPPPEGWGDWVQRQAANNWQKASTASGMDWGRSAVDDASLGFAAPLQSYLTGENTDDIRKRYAASQDALGPIASTALAGATYTLGPGKLLGPLVGAARLGKLAAAGVEGASAGGLSGYGHGERDADKLASDALLSGSAGVAGQAVAKIINAPGIAKARADDPNFGASSNSNWRARAAAGEDIGPEIQAKIAQLPPGDPALPPLSATWDATQQSTEPGKIVKGVSWATQPAARLVNAHFWGVPGFFMSPGTDAGDAVTSIARRVNESAKSAAIQQGLDNTTAAASGQPFYQSPSWTNWLHQPLVGASTTR